LLAVVLFNNMTHRSLLLCKRLWFDDSKMKLTMSHCTPRFGAA